MSRWSVEEESKTILAMDWLGGPGGLVAFVSALAAMVGALVTYGANRRAQYDRVLSETAALTTGEVAEARQLVGRVPRNSHWSSASGSQISGYVRPFMDEEVNALYVVLWQFERLYALYLSLDRVVVKRLPTRPQRLLLRSIAGSVVIWNEIVARRPLDERTGRPANINPNAGSLTRFASDLKHVR